MANERQGLNGILDVEALENIYETLKNTHTNEIQNEIVHSIFENASLEVYESQKDLNELMQRKYCALKCLMSLSQDLSDDFCLAYFDSLLSFLNLINTLKNRRGLKILNGYMNISTNSKDKLLLLQTLTICLANNKIDFSVFEEFPPEEWRIELLLIVLFSDCNLHTVDLDSIIGNIYKLNDLKSLRNPYIIEDFLSVLVSNRNDFKLDVRLINDLLFAITYNQQLLNLLPDNFQKLFDELNHIKMNMILKRCSEFGDTELQEHLSDLKYFLKYPFSVIQIIFTTKNIENFDIILRIKRLLEISDMDLENQIKIISLHDLSEPLDKLKNQIAVEIAKGIITDIFPSYEKYFRQVDASRKVLESIYLVSSSSVKCSCFNMKTKCALHHTTECCDLLYALHKTLAKVISNCSDPSEQVIDVISALVAGINNAKRITELINALDIIDDYDIELSDKQLYEFLSELTAENYEQAVHRYVVNRFFPGTYTKSIEQLLDEVENTCERATSSVVEMFVQVRNCYKNSSSMVSELNEIYNWNKQEIQAWATKIKINKNCLVTDEEILAVIIRAAELTVKLKLRDVQILSVLLMIKSHNTKGRLAEIGTGEGKTLIIAVLAAYCVFKGHQVDIYTSSPLLAIPQSEQYTEFYEVCGISVTHNINPRCRYECDVVYGTNNSFQRDVLLDEFRKSEVRKKRKYDVAIVDEVDNMLIDGNNWILKIACDMPAMDYLEVILAAIYIQVNASASSLVERNGETYYLSEENAIDEQGNIEPEIVVQEIPIEGSKKDFIIKSTEVHLRKLLRDVNSCNEIEDGYPEVKIPNHLRDLICKVQLKKWISSAISAVFNYKKDEDYILKDGKVTIVDADNTGVIKKHSQWCAGLHQFLEIKHGAKVTPENFTTNFISNVGLFTRYKSKLYGLTGTLGSDDTRSFLHYTYDVDSVVIPPFKLKQHKNLKPIVVANEAKYVELARSCIRKLRLGQAALIIMKYIKETDELAEIFSKEFKYDESKIKLFKTDDDSAVVEKPLRPGDVIITTNIAGRGTDIKVNSAVEKNGGLHVCLSFLPVNSRVEHQNIGRTSRKGNKGTSQLVISDPKGLNIDYLKKIRNIHESNIMKGASETVTKIKIKDNIFKKFCDLLGQIKGRGPEVKDIELKAVEERFAIWLVFNENYINNNNNEIIIYKLFDEFKAEILEDDHANTLIKNPFMYVEIGNKFLNEKNFQQAIEEYTNAILLDHFFAEHAYYNRAWAYISEYGHDMDSNEHFINEAIIDLKKSRKLILDKEYSLHLLQTASKGEVFNEQVSHKLNLYGIQKNTIDLAIGPDIDAIDEQLKKINEDLNNNSLPTDYRQKIYQYIQNLEESKKDIGVIGRARLNKRNIESLGDDFMPNEDKKGHIDEIKEFERNGWIGGFKITEIKPIDWFSVFGLLAIGLGQLFIGAALTVFTLGAGASIGMGLISEGVSDIITAVKDGIINREFDWATWALMKVISIAVSVVCAGIKAIKDVARTAYSGAKNVFIQGTKAFTQLRKTGLKIVAKKIGVDLAKGVAKEIVTDLITYGIDKALLPKIEELIIENIRTPIQEALIENPFVSKMLKLDELNKNNYYQNQIKIIAQKLLTPENNSMLKTISLKIMSCVADNKGLAVTRQLCNMLIGSYELATFTNDFISKMNSELNKIKITTSTDNGPPENLQNTNENDVFICQEEIGLKKEDDDIDLKKVGLAEEQIQMRKKVQTTDRITNELAEMVSTNMLYILKGKLIRPITQIGVNYTADKLSSKLHSVDEEMENYRSLKNIVHYQNKRSATSCDDSSITSYEKIKVEEIIERIENGGPAGLIHLGAISNAVDRPIVVYDEKGRHKFTIGDCKSSPPIEIQYQAPKDGSSVGHFTLKGSREPQKEGSTSNMCLFNVIAEQTGHDPNEIKNMSLKMMKNNKSNMAKQINHIRRLEIYDQSCLLEGGAQYNGRNPYHAREFYINSEGIVGFDNIVPGHVGKHIPFRGKTIDKLNAISHETGRHIEVYDKKGNLNYVIGKRQKNVEPIKLQYHTPKGDTFAEYFSSVGGQEKYYMNDPNDMTFYDLISRQTGTNATQLKNASLSRIESMSVPPTKTCIENETKKRPKTGFISEDDAVYVLHHALQTQAAKDAMKELNAYEAGVKDTQDYKKKEVVISEKELNLPRPAFGGYWKKGKMQISWPVKNVVLVLQHYDGHQSNPNARVHIQTFFPKPP